MDYQLTQSIYEAWFPMNDLSYGHKHLCIFTFDKKLPEILNTLHKENGKYSTTSKIKKSLGICNAQDFEAIKKTIEKPANESAE